MRSFAMRALICVPADGSWRPRVLERSALEQELAEEGARGMVRNELGARSSELVCHMCFDTWPVTAAC